MSEQGGNGGARRDLDGADALARPPADALDRAACELAALRQERVDGARSTERLLHSVTHELRTPITIIQGYSKLLLSEQVGPLGPEQQRFVAEIHRSAKRMDRFVKDLLEASPRAGLELRVKLQAAAVDELIHDVVSYLGPLVDEGGRGVEIHIEPGLPAVAMDVDRIEQVLTNLMTNALRYSKPGGVITIAVTGRSLVDGSPGVEFSVSDQGRGVPPSDRTTIFEPYYRGSAASAASEGLGLGLAICKRIVDAHAGTIEVGDAEGGGARFAFQLPVAHSGDRCQEPR